ncbi:cell division cycle protein 123-like [Pelomyxa schiedti]|nr:cell division cycle protein 123-like [Pelomyxa schiedti]
MFSGGDPFRVEKWYDTLGDETFETVFVDISLQEAETLARYRELSRMLHVTREVFGNEVGGQAVPSEPPMSHDEVARLNAVTARLDAPIMRFGKAAVKLSTRSPKDAVMLSDAILNIIERELTPQLSCPEDEWTRKAVTSFVRGCSFGMGVQSGKEAVDLMIKSQRVFEDITKLKLLHGPEGFVLQLAVRRWEEIDPDWEFRCFVVDGIMTACTQYYDMIYVPDIASQRSLVASTILDYFESKIKPKLLHLNSYTLDLAVRPDLKAVRTIELNHPPPTAGTALFNWDSAADRQVMESGPFEFRVNSSLPADAFSRIHPPIREFISALRRGLGPAEARAVCRSTPTGSRGSLCRYTCNICSSGIPDCGPPRRHCTVCNDYDVCDSCWSQSTLPHAAHEFLVILNPPSSTSTASSSTSTSSSSVVNGARMLHPSQASYCNLM